MLGQHNLAGDVPETDFPAVIDESHALAVAGAADGDVRRNEIPSGPHQADDILQRLEVFVDFLQRADIEGGEYFGDVVQALAAARAVAELVVVEIPDVPGADDQARILRAARHALGRRRGELGAQVKQAARGPVALREREQALVAQIGVPDHSRVPSHSAMGDQSLSLVSRPLTFPQMRPESRVFRR